MMMDNRSQSWILCLTLSCDWQLKEWIEAKIQEDLKLSLLSAFKYFNLNMCIFCAENWASHQRRRARIGGQERAGRTQLYLGRRVQHLLRLTMEQLMVTQRTARPPILFLICLRSTLWSGRWVARGLSKCKTLGNWLVILVKITQEIGNMSNTPLGPRLVLMSNNISPPLSREGPWVLGEYWT